MSVSTTEPIAQTGTPGQQGGEGQGSAPPAQQQGGNDEKTFNQQAVNALIGARLKEARQQWEKDQKDAAETAEAEKRGDYEKALAREREKAAAAEERAAATERTARERIVRSEIRSVATELKFADPADAWRFVNPDDVTVSDAGEPTNVTALVEKLAKEKPYLVGAVPQGGAPIPGTPNASQLTQEEFRQQEKERALRSGKYSAL